MFFLTKLELKSILLYFCLSLLSLVRTTITPCLIHTFDRVESKEKALLGFSEKEKKGTKKER